MLASLSPLEIQAAYQAMIDRNLSARTIRYAHSVLRAAIRQAIRWQLLLADPTQGVQLPSPQCREMSVLTTEQARTFLKSASLSPHGCLFAVALTTGMRPSEYLGLCWRDLDWDRGTVSIVRTIHKHEGQWIFADAKRAVRHLGRSLSSESNLWMSKMCINKCQIAGFHRGRSKVLTGS